MAKLRLAHLLQFGLRLFDLGFFLAKVACSPRNIPGFGLNLHWTSSVGCESPSRMGLVLRVWTSIGDLSPCSKSSSAYKNDLGSRSSSFSAFESAKASSKSLASLLHWSAQSAKVFCTVGLLEVLASSIQFAAWARASLGSPGMAPTFLLTGGRLEALSHRLACDPYRR